MERRQRIFIFDTTLRDGQQCPGAGMSFEKNLEYAALVAKLGVDVVEAGFPSASNLDFEIVKTIAELYAGMPVSPTVAALCQLRDEQIDRTIESLLPLIASKRGRLHTYVPVAPGLMEVSLGEKANKNKIAKDVYSFISRGVESGLEVEFSPEGYSRQGENFDFVTDLIRAAVEAGAGVINCPDTIGGSCQFEGQEYFVEKMKSHAEIISAEFPNKSILWSAHCHNDFGLAVQNSLNAVYDGPARQIEGCFNGVGERAGNAALEAIIMIIRTHKSRGDVEYYTNIDVSVLQEVCNFVSTYMLKTQAHWPVSGDNAARHSSGGHTNAVLKDPLCYQPFDPREIGKDISFLFGPLSGGNHAKAVIEQAGYRCLDEEKAEIAQSIKTHFKDRRKGITDEEVLLGYFAYRSPIRIDNFNYSRTANASEVQLEGVLFDKSGEIKEVHTGRDSALAALKKAVDAYFPVNIHSHKSESGRSGYDAESISVIVIIDQKGDLYEGQGSDQDIEISAMKAFISAVNRAYIEQNYRSNKV